ncbi:hypothetical protein DY000_02007728 [Brassica cretica]|uniref:Uncharacterized protein n=1 Tax=Brassica cretica TaxID=69181 RepID=A0ABQ7CFM5_BRACR|nr:hypothetical protein DY000_02007728 [Brassica cretica]
MHGFVSYRRFGIARSLRSDRTERTLIRYVATKRDGRSIATSEVNERANPAQKPLAGELNHHAGQLAGELNHHFGQLAGELNYHFGQLTVELNRRVVILARRAQPSRRSARR